MNKEKIKRHGKKLWPLFALGGVLLNTSWLWVGVGMGVLFFLFLILCLFVWENEISS